MELLKVLSFSGAAYGIYRYLLNPPAPKIKFVDTPRRGSYNIGPLSEITEVTLHHTATPANWSPERIAAIHTDQNGWPGIGYDFLVYANGDILQVNTLETINYHNGTNNTNAIGVAMVGNFDQGEIPAKQRSAVLRLIRWLNRRDDLPNLRHLYGHNEKKSTACPGRYTNMTEFRQRLKMTAP